MQILQQLLVAVNLALTGNIVGTTWTEPDGIRRARQRVAGHKAAFLA
jgi:hypothetical protein